MARPTFADCQLLLEIASSIQCSSAALSVRRLEFLKSLQQLISYEFAGCHLLRRDSGMIESCYHPGKPSYPASHPEFWRIIQTHPLNPTLFKAPEASCMLTDVTSARRFRSTELYDVLYRPLGVDLEMTGWVEGEDGSGLILLVSLHRERIDFTERERALLNLLLKPLKRLAKTDEDSRTRREFDHPPAVSFEIFKSRLSANPRWTLTARESEVLFWLHQGKRNAEIGKILGISERTAETHALRAYPKLGVENRFSAIAAMNSALSSR